MGLTVEQIASHPALESRIRRQSGALIAAFETDPRLTAVFATQQRWLMAHAALALYFGSADLVRKLRDAEALGSIRWEGKCGQSVM